MQAAAASIPVIADIVLRQLSSIRALTYILSLARSAEWHHFAVTKTRVVWNDSLVTRDFLNQLKPDYLVLTRHVYPFQLKRAKHNFLV